MGNNTSIQEEKFLKYFPANFTIVYYIRFFSQTELEQAISDKVLTPDTTRAGLDRWLSKNSSRRKDDHGRADPNKAHHDRMVQSLLQIWKASPNIVELWRQSPK